MAAAYRRPYPNSTGPKGLSLQTTEWNFYGMLPASFRGGRPSCLFGKGTNMLHIAIDLPPSLDFRVWGWGWGQPLSWDSFQDFRKSYSWSSESPPLSNRQNEQIKNQQNYRRSEQQNKYDLIEMYRTLHLRTTEYPLFSSVLKGAFTKRDHILGYKTKLNNFIRTEINYSFWQ